ncbi:MAG TPA: alpha/beta fold hydrolase [Thermaerobacter sp.]
MRAGMSGAVARPRAAGRRRLLRWVAGGLLAVVAAVVGISWRVGIGLIHPEREPVTGDPSSRGLAFEAVTFTSRDGLSLKGWFLPAVAGGGSGGTSGRSGVGQPAAGRGATGEGQAPAGAGPASRTVIFAHGYGKNRLQDDVPGLDVAAALVRAGYNVLMFDFRNSGESGGERTTVGQEEVRDLAGAVDWVRRTHGSGQRIGLLGWSMGAVTSILAAGGPVRVDAVVADAPFSDLSTYLDENLAHWTGLPEFPFNWTIRVLLPPLVGLHVDRVRPVEAVARFGDTPLLLIHGTEDEVIGDHHSLRLFEAARAAGVEADLWLVPGAGHVKGYATAPDAYLQRVLAFFDRHLR